jgi:hypothetical protein
MDQEVVIVVSDTTPQVLHYQCTNHAYMGNAVQVNSNISGGLVGTPDIDCGTGSFTGDVDIADKIIHTGDTNTAIRFPAADTFTVETGGSEALRVDSSQRLLVGTSNSPTAGSGAVAKSVFQGNTSNSAGAGYLSLQRGQSAASISSGETLGLVNFADSAGNDYAIIKGRTGAAGGSNDYPGELVFGTTADGASSTTDRLVITSAGNVSIKNDSGKFTAGAGDDLEIFSDGTNGVIKNINGRGYIQSDTGINLTKNGNSETLAIFNADSAVELYYDNSKKFETKSDGIDVTGEVQCDSLDVDGTTHFDDDVTFDGASYNASWDKSANALKFADNATVAVGSGEDLQLFHDGSNSYINNDTGDLYIRNKSDDKDIRIISDNSSGGTTTYIECDGSTGKVELYYYGTEKLRTESAGVEVTGTLNATAVTQDGKGLATTGKAIAMAMVFG